MHYTEIVKVSPPLSPPSLALPKPVQENTARPPRSSSAETIASILVALFLLAIATAVVFVYRWRFGQSAKNNHHESEIALVQGTGTYWLIFVFTITNYLMNYIAKNGKNLWFYLRDEIVDCDMNRYHNLPVLNAEFLCCNEINLIYTCRWWCCHDISCKKGAFAQIDYCCFYPLKIFLINVSPTLG